MDPKRKIMRAISHTLSPSQRPVLEVEGQSFIVGNLSIEGLGIWLGSQTWPIPVNKNTFQAIVFIGKKNFPCEMCTVHQSGFKVGLKFVNRSSALTQILESLLEPSSQAGLVVPHPLNLQLDQEREERVLWYEGINGSSVKVWFKEDTGLISELHVSVADKEARRSFQKAAQFNFREPAAHYPIEQFLAALPLPLPGVLLWQFLETGEQVYLPEKLRHSKQVA